MRILQISSAKNFGGGEKHFVDLCRGLTERGHDVAVVARPFAGWLEQLSFLPPEKVFHLPLRNSLDFSSAIKIAEIIRRQKIEIVHAHLARDYAIAAIAARIEKTAKLILTRHVFFPLNFLHKFILPTDATFIAPTAEGREKLLRQKILSARQVHLIYYGIDTKHFAESLKKTNQANLREQLNLPAGNQLVGIAGEITAHKGQTDFVKAASIILKKFPDAEFLVIGEDGSPRKKHQKHLEKIIAKLGLQNKIHLLGFWKDAAPFYAMLDVFVSASRVEPFGLVIAEAMASRRAVVATSTDGAREIITDETGKIVPVKNSEAIAEAVAAFLGNRQMREDFGRKAQIRIEENFSLEKMLNETEKLYRNLSEEKSGYYSF
ncbi:MAG: glycosyltransferase family 4 protein [Pyrinomonadaceae bacterium]